jgi:hypothetical protein
MLDPKCVQNRVLVNIGIEEVYAAIQSHTFPSMHLERHPAAAGGHEHMKHIEWEGQHAQHPCFSNDGLISM